MTDLRVVALDLSLEATGLVATHNHRGEPGLLARTVHTSRTAHGEHDMDHDRVNVVLTDVAAAVKCRPHLVTIEWLPLYEGKGDASLRLAELHGVIKHWLWSKRIRYGDVKPTYLQMYATGKGRASKTVVRQAIIATYGRLVHIGDHNQADAMALAALTLDAYGQPLAPVPQTHRRAVTAVTWPQISPDVPTLGVDSNSAGRRGREVA